MQQKTSVFIGFLFNSTYRSYF